MEDNNQYARKNYRSRTLDKIKCSVGEDSFEVPYTDRLFFFYLFCSLRRTYLCLTDSCQSNKKVFLSTGLFQHQKNTPDRLA